MLAIVATDGSEVSIDAVRRATTVLPAGSDLLLVTAIPPEVDPNEDATGFAGPTIGPDEARQQHSADRIAADAALAATAAALGPFPIDQRVVEGEPGPAVCELAERLGADVVVVGSHGRGWITSTLLGSVSSHVIAHAPCPVLVVRARRV